MALNPTSSGNFGWDAGARFGLAHKSEVNLNVVATRVLGLPNPKLTH